jgi:hypothetical protein
MKKKTVSVMGAAWTYKLYDEKRFLEIHPDCEDTGAITLPDSKEMHFILGLIDIGTVRHEVRHAFIAELCLDSTELTVDQFEEINCTLDQNRWEEMNEVSLRIYENLVLS